MITVSLNSKLTLAGNIPKEVTGAIKKRLTMTNPLWIENERFSRWNVGIPRELTYYEETESGLIVPRGSTRSVLSLLKKARVPYRFVDQTRALPELGFTFTGKLRPFQEEAAAKILASRFGVVQMPTGSGKTVVALSSIARRCQPALVIVHTRELLYQWQEAARQFLGLRGDELGLIGDRNNKIGTRLTVAIVNSLYKRAPLIADKIGFVIVDECHHVPARTFTEAVSAFGSRFMLGLSATPVRRDGLGQLINLYLGNEVVTVDQRVLLDSGFIMGADLILRETDFDYLYEDDYQAMITALAADEARNRMIATDVASFAQGSTGPALVVTGRKAHCGILGDLIKGFGVGAAVVTGSTRPKERSRIIEDLHAGKLKVLIATTQLIGEGFDCPSLSALFLATPIRYGGKVQQVVGRILRVDPGKPRPVVYDYVDRVGVLQASFRSRMETYQNLGITVPN